VFRRALNKVRVVMSNGATFTAKVPWVDKDTKQIWYRFVDLDQFNDSKITGKASGLKAVGSRARFAKRYGEQPSA